MSALAALGSRIPPPLRTVRFRIAFLTAASLVVLAGLVVGAFHFTISATLEDEQRLNDFARPGLVAGEDGRLLRTNTLVVADAVDLERAATARTLRTLRDVALGALGVLFVFTLGVAWLVAGRFLRPVDEMASTVRRIEATTLSQRLALEGPEHELKRLADAVDGLLARLESAFALQRRYVAEASHELRNPLAVIRTNLDVALAEQHGPADNLRSHANVALRATDRMAGILRDLLAVSRLEAPGSRNREVDLAEVAAEVSDELDALAALRGLVIVRRLAPGLCVAGDREALKRALANLVDNAVRLAPGGSRIEIVGSRSNGWVELAVTDEGPGIDPEDRAHVFDRFWQGDRSRPGSGLGLALVRQVAESHGGRASVRPAPGGGSTFEIGLPVAA